MAMQKHVLYTLQCVYCKQHFLAQRIDRMYCSRECKQRTYCGMPLTETIVVKETRQTMSNIVEISLKGKTKFQVDLDEVLDESFPAVSFKQLIVWGLEHGLGAGMQKITGVKDAEGEELIEIQEKVMEIAEKNMQNLREGKARSVKGGTKIAGAVKTRAMQKARAIVKDTLRKHGLKVSAYKAKEITAEAEKLLAAHPEIIQEAEAELNALKEKSKAVEIDVSHMVKEEAKVKPRKGNVKALEAARAARGKKGEARAHN